MSKKTMKNLKRLLCFAVIAAMTISFMPIRAAQVSAASFSTTQQVTGLTVSSRGYDYVNLKWNAYDGATGYQVYRSTKKSGDFKKQGTTEGTAFKNKGTHKKVYYFKVRAYKKDSKGTKTYSKFSDVKKITMNLAKPVVTIVPTQSKVKIQWGEVKNCTGYQLKYATKSSGEYKTLKTTSGKNFEQSLKSTQVRYYKVRAFKRSGGKTYFGPYSAAQMGVTKRPAPVGVSAIAINNSIRVSWDKVDYATGYKVFRSTSSTSGYSALGTTTSQSYRDATAQMGTKYYYKVEAYVKLSGVDYFSGDSAYSSRKYDFNSPVVTVTPGDDLINITWQTISGATGYQVYRATSANGTYTKLGKTSGSSFSNTEVSEGTIYYYRVRAYAKTSSGNIYGAYSAEKRALTKLAIPTHVKGTSTTKSIKVTWDGVKNATSYEVCRSTSAGGTYTTLGTTSGTAYTDSNGLKKGTSYFYKVRASMKMDGVTYYSDYNSPTTSRDKIISVAKGWDNCKESNGSHKKIIDVYNSDLAPGCGKLPYSAAWCAAFVSAVGIKAKATDIIIRHSYCPTMLSKYKNKKQYSSNKKYTPMPGDVVFFDWNKNGNPDHVGYVYSVSGSTIKSIEGNKSDKVDYRTFSKGYTYLQGYGLPAYDDSSGVTYTGSNTVATASALKNATVSAGEPDGFSDIGGEYDTAEEQLSVGCGEDATEMEQMEVMLKALRSEAETSDLQHCSESEYYAAFLFKLCQDADIDACIVTEPNEDGDNVAWVEATLDGQLYRVDPSKEGNKPVKYTPEVTDYNEDDPDSTEVN